MEWKKADTITPDTEKMQSRFSGLPDCEPDIETIDEDTDEEVVPEEYFDEETAGIENEPQENEETSEPTEDEPDLIDENSLEGNEEAIPTMTSDEFIKAYIAEENKAERLRDVDEVKEEMAAYSAMLKREAEEQKGEKPAPNFAGFIQSYNSSFSDCPNCAKRRGNQRGK
ncbi:MAG: hypothetical protein ACI4J1_11430 [Ruminiclostridium sp.]